MSIQSILNTINPKRGEHLGRLNDVVKHHIYPLHIKKWYFKKRCERIYFLCKCHAEVNRLIQQAIEWEDNDEEMWLRMTRTDILFDLKNWLKIMKRKEDKATMKRIAKEVENKTGIRVRIIE